MITATGNRMPLLKTASHNAFSDSVASLAFFFPSALSHIKFTSLSNPQVLLLLLFKRLIHDLKFACVLNFLFTEKKFFFHTWITTMAAIELSTFFLNVGYEVFLFLEIPFLPVALNIVNFCHFCKCVQVCWLNCELSITFKEDFSFKLFSKREKKALFHSCLMLNCSTWLSGKSCFRSIFIRQWWLLS